MKRIVVLLALVTAFTFSQCLVPKAAIGIKPGFNFTTYNPDDGGENLSGIGINIGLGFGLDVGGFGVEIAPSFRTTDYNRTDETWNITTRGHFNNFYLPARVKLIAGLPMVAPYLGFGIAFDLQRSGYWELETGSSSYRTDVPSDELENDVFASLALGADIKMHNAKIAPELAFDYNLTADNDETSNRTEMNYDLTFSIGIYYCP